MSEASEPQGTPVDRTSVRNSFLFYFIFSFFLKHFLILSSSRLLSVAQAQGEGSSAAQGALQAAQAEVRHR